MAAQRTIHLFVFLLATSAGCAGLQDSEYCAATWARAECGWLSSTTTAERWQLSSDYEKGWKDGFKASATGQACNLPAVPPPCYWSHKYQSCEGQAAIADWYRGWQCGAAAAESRGLPAFHEVPVGPRAPTVLTSDCYACAVPDKCHYEIQTPAPYVMPGPVIVSPTEAGTFSPTETVRETLGEPLGLIGPVGPSANGLTASPVQTVSAEQNVIR